MTPEERVNQYYWWVLGKLKESLLTTPDKEPVPYRLSHVAAAGVPNHETETRILLKLQEMGALKVRDNPWEPPVGGGDLFYVDIFQPKFDEVYKKYQLLYDPEAKDAEDQESYFEFIKNKKDQTSHPKLVTITPGKTKEDIRWQLLNRLDERKNSFIDLPEREFFLGIADYIKFIIETPELEKIAQIIKHQEQIDEKEVASLEKIVIDETEKASKVIDKLVVSNHIEGTKIASAFQEYWSLRDGMTQSSATRAEALWGGVAFILGVINSQGHGDLLKKFAKIHDSGGISEYTFSPHYDEYKESLRKFRNLRKTTVWGSWDSLVLVYLTVHQFDEELKKLDPIKDMWKRMNFIGLHGEMQEILNNNQTKRFEFIQSEYKTHVSRVHGYFEDQLTPQFIKDAGEKILKTAESLRIAFTVPQISLPTIQVPESLLKGAGTAVYTDQLVKANQSFNALGSAVQEMQKTFSSFGSAIKSAQLSTEVLDRVQHSQDFLTNIPVPQSFNDKNYQKEALEAEKLKVKVAELENKVKELELKQLQTQETTSRSKKTDKAAVTKDLKGVIKERKIVGKEKELLVTLSDFKEHKMSVLVSDGISKSNNSLSKLKAEVKKKLSGTNFNVKELSAGFSDPTGSYQLEYLLNSKLV